MPRRARPSSADPGVLVPFRPAEAEVILGWVASDEEAWRWASLSSKPTDVAMFERWHAEAGVRPYLLVAAGSTVAYGEIWEDPDEDEAELARLIVDPSKRGRGVGRTLVTALADEARRLGWSNIWLRVVPDNEPALRAYAAAGFVRATAAVEGTFNAGQPVAFVWLRWESGANEDAP